MFVLFNPSVSKQIQLFVILGISLHSVPSHVSVSQTWPSSFQQLSPITCLSISLTWPSSFQVPSHVSVSQTWPSSFQQLSPIACLSLFPTTQSNHMSQSLSILAFLFPTTKSHHVSHSLSNLAFLFSTTQSHHMSQSPKLCLPLSNKLGLPLSNILYIQRFPQRSPDSAVTGPVEIGPIPMRTTASTGGSIPRLYCHRSTQYIVHLCRRRHSCQRGTNTIALLCLLCSSSTPHNIPAMYPGVSLEFDGVTLPQVVLDAF
jgi:hypothetical protein